MKRLSILLIMCSLAIGCLAQTQQGIVKTKGRMVNGKHVAGQGLSGATVTIQGRNAMQSQTNGGFSFPIPNKTFMLQGVQKNGYQLVDPDATRKAYHYSPNTFYIVMETPDQQSEDKLAAERKIRRTLQRQLQQREDELEELKAQNKLTQEEYRKAMQQLYDDQQNNEKLIADMAEEYAKMDYDQMDELNRQISNAILNGELTKADSLLRTKGDINARLSQVRKAQQVEAQEEAELARRQENLAASKEGTKKKLEDLAQDCKNYFDRFKIANQHDSAAYYIELRAELDTTNAEWQYDAAYYLLKQRQHQRSEHLYLRTLEICKHLVLSNPETYEPSMAQTYEDLGNLYRMTKRSVESEYMYKKSLEIWRRLDQQTPQVNLPGLASVLTSLAMLCQNEGRYTESEAMYKEALHLYQSCVQLNPQTYEPSVVMVQDNLAGLYMNTQRYLECEELYKECLEKYQQLSILNPRVYEPSIAVVKDNLAMLYKKTQRLQESEAMYLDALKIYRRIAEANPQAYELYLANVLYNLSNLYKEMRRDSEAETKYKEYEEALEIANSYTQPNYAAIYANAAAFYENLGDSYYMLTEYTKSEEMYCNALEFCKMLFEKSPDIFRSKLASVQYWLMRCYAENKKHEQYDSTLNEALIHYEILSREDDSYIAKTVELRNRKGWRLFMQEKTNEAMVYFESAYQLDPQKAATYLTIGLNQKAYEYANAKDFAKALETIDRAITLKQDNANLYDTKGEILLMNGDEKGAVEMWKKVMELDPDFLSKHDGTTELFRQLKERGLVE